MIRLTVVLSIVLSILVIAKPAKADLAEELYQAEQVLYEAYNAGTSALAVRDMIVDWKAARQEARIDKMQRKLEANCLEATAKMSPDREQVCNTAILFASQRTELEVIGGHHRYNPRAMSSFGNIFQGGRHGYGRGYQGRQHHGNRGRCGGNWARLPSGCR